MGVAGELELRVGAIIEAFATTRPVVEVTLCGVECVGAQGIEMLAFRAAGIGPKADPLP